MGSTKVRLAACLLLILSVGLVSFPAEAGKRVALVVGNGAYLHIPGLANTKNDARGLASGLRRLGFQVLEAIDTDFRTLRDYIHSFSNALIDAELGLFFYAGHGIAVDGINYIIPVDANLTSYDDVERQLISTDRVVRALNYGNIPSVVMLDACRENPFVPNLQKSGDSRRVTRGLASMKPRKSVGGGGLSSLETGNINMYVAFATQPGNLAADGLVGDRHSPFSKALIENLHRKVEIRELMGNVRASVVRRTNNQHVPWDQSSLVNTIYLAGKPKPATRRRSVRTRPPPP